MKENKATVVVVLDVSGSMAANDAKPTRIAAAKQVAYRIARGLPKGYRMAVETFSDHSDVVAPPSSDLTRVRRHLEQFVERDFFRCLALAANYGLALKSADT